MSSVSCQREGKKRRPIWVWFEVRVLGWVAYLAKYISPHPTFNFSVSSCKKMFRLAMFKASKMRLDSPWLVFLPFRRTHLLNLWEFLSKNIFQMAFSGSQHLMGKYVGSGKGWYTGIPWYTIIYLPSIIFVAILLSHSFWCIPVT